MSKTNISEVVNSQPTSTAKHTTEQIGNEVAQEMGYENAVEFINETKAKVRSASKATAQAGKAAALDFTSKLLSLVLYQEIKSEYNLGKYTWIDKFDDERIEAGDGKQYIKNLLTGVDSYDVNKFVPDNATPPSADAKVIRLYKNDGTLDTYGFQALKPLTIIESAWFPYFMSGKLMQFIDSQIDIMRKSMFLYKYAMFSKFFKDLTAATQDNTKTGIISKRVIGTATNILSCFVNDIFPMVEDMQYFNNEYSRDATKNAQYPNINNRDDLLLIMNRKTLGRFKNGALSNQLNNKLVDFNNVLPLENIIGTGKDITVGTSGDNVSVADTELIPENTVVIINKNLIKYLWFVEVTDSQKFVQNLSMQFVHHLWGVFGQLDWEGAVVYTNDNLLALPITVR